MNTSTEEKILGEIIDVLSLISIASQGDVYWSGNETVNGINTVFKNGVYLSLIDSKIQTLKKDYAAVLKKFDDISNNSNNITNIISNIN